MKVLIMHNNYKQRLMNRLYQWIIDGYGAFQQLSTVSTDQYMNTYLGKLLLALSALPVSFASFCMSVKMLKKVTENTVAVLIVL